MIGIGSILTPIASAFLLTYLVYSTVTTALAWGICHSRCMKSAVSRVRCWKLAILLPIGLSAVATVVPAPWLPVFRIQPMAAGVQNTTPIGESHQTLLPRQRMRPERASLPTVKQSQRHGSISRRGESAGIESSRGELHATSPSWLSLFAGTLIVAWPLGMLVGLGCLTSDLLKLNRLIRSGRSITTGPLYWETSKLRERMQLHRSVRLLESPRVNSPFAAGWWSPCILLPSGWMEQLSAACRQAVLAHELSHIVTRDAIWNLLSQIVCRTFWFQPLNVVSVRHLRRDMEFVADHQAARIIDNPADLARSLVQLAERLKSPSGKVSNVPAIAAGMSVHASGLKGRVSAVLSYQGPASEPIVGTKMVGLTCLVCFVLLIGVPRFGIPASNHFSGETSGMHIAIKKLGLLTALVAAATTSPADDTIGQAKMDRTSGVVGRTDSNNGLPDGLNQFSGMLIGEMVERDIERGNFTVKVQYVARVWENNKAPRPRSVVGKQVTVTGVTGKWLDELLLVRPGETVEFEAQHRGGNALTFPGEWLKKVPAFDPAEHPVPAEGFRGFSGMVTGQIVKKDPTSRELHLRIDAIEKAFEKNKARSAADAIGKEIVLAGFWARMSKPFDKLEKGDRIRAGVLHRVPQSDHFTVIELAEKIAKGEQHSDVTTESPTPSSGFPDGMKGFRGILRGKLINKDVEKGTLVFEADRATRTWKANRASDTDSCRGRQFLVTGISGKWIDVLITLKTGDLIEVEAFHNSGEHLDFIAEWLKKVD
ncbi:Regulatory protein BlaR1 [Stieleria maiorica]|uniref:Regulatory protein BlaR1 n=1 Tax=Stieleria maiorica TaxID=2795974 RepID=A0A5B9MJP7_9BACT|nr:M56 family metallopeptidase [Stieleria maiorica]QEG01593.1 Regulatory protein BlaR1 [Stieleria maiorica]